MMTSFVRGAVTILLTSLLAVLVSASASAQVEGPLPPLTFDRVDDPSSVWRLDQFVTTTETSAPTTPSPVYIQFGFMGCVPCEVLAQEVNRTLGDEVVKLYVHLDDVLLRREYEGHNQGLWRALWSYAQEAPYDTFTVARRGSTGLMHELCGPDTNAPTGLLILPDGQLFEILTSGDVEVARDAFERFEAAYRAQLAQPSSTAGSTEP